jgi:hypothetical protein
VRRLPLLALLLPLHGCLYPRQELERPAALPYRFNLFPYPTYDGDEGIQGWLSAGWRRPANRLPAPVSENINIEARYAASGTRGIALSWDRAGRSRHWRSYARIGFERLNRAPYYGVGNEAAEEVDSLAALEPPYYRYQLLRSTGYAVYQRELVRNVRAHAALQARHYRVLPLGAPSLYGEDVANAVIADVGSATSAELRGGLLYDTRNEEATPTRGILLEGMWATSIGDHRYDRFLISARGFLPFGAFDQWVLGLRSTTELATGRVPFYVAYERLTTWHLEDGFGGERSLRLQLPGRYVAPNRSVASVDLRKKVLDMPLPTSPFRVWVVGFADVGRLWRAGESPSFTGLHWSGGVGGRVQISKVTMFGMDVGATDQGAGFAVSTSFAF